MAHQVTINFSDKAYQVLEELARHKGKTVEAAIGDAIGLEKWFLDTRRQGGKILVERSGKIREVLPYP